MKSYDEVLDATKHQDDKIGRFLTAIAFLTVAAATLVTRLEGILSTRYEIDGVARPLPAMLLGVFLVLTILGVILLLIGLGPNLTLPGRFPGSGQGRPRSYLFFLAIRNSTLPEWRARWNVSGYQLRARFHQDLIDETLNIAKKVYFKYRRADEARALLSLALIALLLGVVLGLYPTVQHLEPPVSLPWRGFPVLVTTVILTLGVLVLGYDYWRAEYEDKDVGNAQALPTLFGIVGLGTYTISILAFHGDSEGWGLVGVVASMLLIVGAYCWSRRDSRPYLLITALIFPTMALVIGMYVVRSGLQGGQLFLAFSLPFMLEAPRLIRNPVTTALLGREKKE